jgi:hypothetical protein
VTVLHDSHAIPPGDEHPPVLALLLAAIRAVLVLMREALTAAETAADAIRAYAQVAGLEPDTAREHIIAAVGAGDRSHVFTGSDHDARVAALWAQRPRPGEIFTSLDGRLFTVKAKGKNNQRLYLWADGSGSWSARQATRRGPLLRADLLHRPEEAWEPYPGGEEADLVQICAHCHTSWPCRVAESAGIAQRPTVPISEGPFAERAPF